jgi:uncharacterized protein YndB with AHSA1/START domain
VGYVCFTTHVEAPLAEVFALHVDPARIPDWFPGVRAVEDLSGPLDRRGTTYRLRFNRLFASRGEVVASSPPGMHARTWDARPLGSTGKATLFFQATRDGGTRIDFESSYELPFGPLGRLLDRLPPVRGRADASMRRELASFKALAEREFR